ncbi:ATP-binding cassette domain-containing protein [Spirulina sp. 06S082]|uniref:ATP-binding cassette domain-containing protein n=1 Tax=Spirulina sp. 06S082 TaxID=3110248 RepID=UPI002B1F3235|nr:ATP-binding cassette domain-containing protein [Spirulina sp. 06S082]MEA5470483.1 ATP-binding cassette domain-containing protein [Spirulina sp. 06S082]
MHDRATPILQLQQVSFAASLGSGYLLQDISFEIDKSDRVALIGASGSGKTTLLRLLNRLNDPALGKIFFNTSLFSTLPILQLRREIVLVLQEPKLLGMQVEAALAYPLILQKIPKREIKERIEKWCRRMRIPEEWRDRNELQLSLGQRQLVAITRALILEPKILLLDEPTSALDVGKATHLLTVLRELSEDEKMTIIMANHQLELAQEFCDRILYLQHGQLIQDTPTDRLDWSKLGEELRDREKQIVEEWES